MRLGVTAPSRQTFTENNRNERILVNQVGAASDRLGTIATYSSGTDCL